MAASWNFPLSSDFKSSVRFYAIEIVKTQRVQHSPVIANHNATTVTTQRSNPQDSNSVTMNGFFSELPYASVWKRVWVQKLSYENEFDLHENEAVGWTHFHMTDFTRKLISTERQKGNSKITYFVAFNYLCNMKKGYFRKPKYKVTVIDDTIIIFSKTNVLVNLKVEGVLFLSPLYGQTKLIVKQVSDVISQTNSDKQSGMVEDLTLLQVCKQVFLKQFFTPKFGVHFPPISLRTSICYLTLVGCQ